jgi:hypothetical protein
VYLFAINVLCCDVLFTGGFAPQKLLLTHEKIKLKDLYQEIASAF